MTMTSHGNNPGIGTSAFRARAGRLVKCSSWEAQTRQGRAGGKGGACFWFRARARRAARARARRRPSCRPRRGLEPGERTRTAARAPRGAHGSRASREQHATAAAPPPPAAAWSPCVLALCAGERERETDERESGRAHDRAPQRAVRDAPSATPPAARARRARARRSARRGGGVVGTRARAARLVARRRPTRAAARRRGRARGGSRPSLIADASRSGGAGPASSPPPCAGSSSPRAAATRSPSATTWKPAFGGGGGRGGSGVRELESEQRGEKPACSRRRETGRERGGERGGRGRWRSLRPAPRGARLRGAERAAAPARARGGGGDSGGGGGGGAARLAQPAAQRADAGRPASLCSSRGRRAPVTRRAGERRGERRRGERRERRGEGEGGEGGEGGWGPVFALARVDARARARPRARRPRPLVARVLFERGCGEATRGSAGRSPEDPPARGSRAARA